MKFENLLGFIIVVVMCIPTTLYLLSLSFGILNSSLPYALGLTLLASAGVLAMFILAVYGAYNVFGKEAKKQLTEGKTVYIKKERNRENVTTN